MVKIDMPMPKSCRSCPIVRRDFIMAAGKLSYHCPITGNVCSLDGDRNTDCPMIAEEKDDF